MTRHPLAEVLAVLLSDQVAGTDVGRTCDAISALCNAYTDEKRADLYALLAESVYPGQAFESRRVACEIALRRNDRRFPHG